LDRLGLRGLGDGDRAGGRRRLGRGLCGACRRRGRTRRERERRGRRAGRDHGDRLRRRAEHLLQVFLRRLAAAAEAAEHLSEDPDGVGLRRLLVDEVGVAVLVVLVVVRFVLVFGLVGILAVRQVEEARDRGDRLGGRVGGAARGAVGVVLVARGDVGAGAVHVVGCGVAAIAGGQGHGAGRGRLGGRRGGAAGGRVSVTLGRLAGQVLVVCARVARDGDQRRRVGIRGRVVCSRRVGVVGFVVGGKGGFVCARVALVRARRALGNGVVRGGIR